MSILELRDEFQTQHMRATAIELSNRQNTGWVQRKDANELLEITYPSSDVRRALEAVSVASSGKSVLMSGQRGSGKSHIMALIHNAFEFPDAVQSWANAWGQRLGAPKLESLQLQRGFKAISETLSNQEYPTLWDVIFEKHSRGPYFRGRFEQSGIPIPKKSLLQDMFAEQKTVLILDELQTWYDGLHDESGSEGKKRQTWAFNFIQILSELAVERPDLLRLVASVRNNATAAFDQIHRDGPIVIDFKGEMSRQDRKRLVLHRLFQNRSNVAPALIEQFVSVYSNERVRLFFADKNSAEQLGHKQECSECWPFSPELLKLLEDHILMAASAQDNRDFIRMLAEVFRSRGQQVSVVTPTDFSIDDDDCGVTTLIDSFATTSDQEGLRDRALRNLSAVKDAKVNAPHAREVISSIWVRSLSSADSVGATRQEVQLDLAGTKAVDDNLFTAELAEIVEHSFNIHGNGTQEKRFCFQIPENQESKLKSWARNDRAFESQSASVPGLLAVSRDQEYLRQFLNHYLKTPDGTRELPSQIVVLDPNWIRAPWANIPQAEQPAGWTEKGKPVLIVLPVSPSSLAATLGPWLADHVPQNRNMVRFLLPKSDQPDIYLDRDLVITARCALLAREWAPNDPQYKALQSKYEGTLRSDFLKGRFDRYALLATWDFQTPAACSFHEEVHGASGAGISDGVEKHVRENYFAPEDFEEVVIGAAKRNETMRQLLTLLREPPLPGQRAIPYLGDVTTYENVLRMVAKDKVAVNVSGRWFAKEPDETFDETARRLQQGIWCTGQAMFAVRLGELSQVGGGGVSVVAAVSPQPTVISPVPGGQPPTTGGGPSPFPSPQPFTPISQPISEPEPAAVPPQPVVRRSLGAKSGINLLGDVEKWALPDAQKVTQAMLTFNGISVKDLRDLCTKLPPKLQAELQIVLPPEDGSAT